MTTIRLQIAFLVLLLSGCDKQPAEKRPPTETRPAYSLVAIEIGLRNRLEDCGLLEKYSYQLAADRFRLAGPSVLPEFAQALEDSQEGNRAIAGWGLLALTQNECPEKGFRYVIERLKRLPPSSEAKWLLFAIAHDGIEKYPEVIPYAAHYLDDRDVAHRINRGGKVEPVHVCDYACLILQLAAKQDFGAVSERGNDEAVEKAKTWIRQNPELVRIRE